MGKVIYTREDQSHGSPINRLIVYIILQVQFSRSMNILIFFQVKEESVQSTGIDKGNFQLFVCVGPAPELPGKLYLNIYQGQNDLAKPQSMGSISAPSTHYMSALLKKITKKEHSGHKR